MLPLRLGEDPIGFEGQVQAIAGAQWKTESHYAEEILTVLSGDDRTADRLLDTMVERLASSHSFDMSNRIIRFWRDAGVTPTEAQYHRLVKAEHGNIDVSNANAWPDLKRKLRQAYGSYTYEPEE